LPTIKKAKCSAASAGSWAFSRRFTGVLFAAAFVALPSGWGGAASLLAFTAAVILAWAWLAAVSVFLYRAAH
jgi:hypothetical protein